MRAIGYVRRSKKSDEKVVSLDVQKRVITEYCKRHNLILTGFLEHDGVSGTKRARFAILDEAIKENGASCVVYYHQDRIARDIHLGDWLKTCGVELHEAAGAGKVDTASAIGRGVVNLRATFDQMYAEIIGEKTRDALRDLKADGCRYSNIPPLGYCYVQGRMVPDPEEQRALELIRHAGRLGFGARKTLDILKNANYRGRQSLKAIHQALRREL